MIFLFVNVIDLVLSGLKFTSHWFAHCCTLFKLSFKTVAEEAGSSTVTHKQVSSANNLINLLVGRPLTVHG